MRPVPAVLALLLTCAVLVSSAQAKIIHRERSLYSTILVDRKGSTI